MGRTGLATKAMAALMLLAGCGGGELMDVGPTGNITAPENLPDPVAGSSPAAWSNSSEYRSSNGLSQIFAAEAYAGITGAQAGQGVRVAVIDTAVDERHFDLQRAFGIEDTCDDNRCFEFVDSVEDRTHGTHVAGIIGARRNGQGVMGVAYNSDLVSIAAATERTPSGFPAFTSEAIAAAITSAAGVGGVTYGDPTFGNGQVSNGAANSDIMNLSLGGGPPNQDVRDALEIAVQQNKIIVMAAGNNRGVTRPEYPARFADDLDGLGIAVMAGSRNADGTPGTAFFTNGCRDITNCLVAPGVDINSTVPGNGFDELSGTSMAAPHVAGAAAVVKAAFPGVSSRAVVSRLLDTADPVPGCTTTCGQGFLNLAGAITPTGTLSLAVAGTELYEPLTGGAPMLASSSLSVPEQLGASFASLGGLEDVIAVDPDGFPFAVPVSSHVRAVDRERWEQSFQRTYSGFIDLLDATGTENGAADGARAALPVPGGSQHWRFQGEQAQIDWNLGFYAHPAAFLTPSAGAARLASGFGPLQELGMWQADYFDGGLGLGVNVPLSSQFSFRSVAFVEERQAPGTAETRDQRFTETRDTHQRTFFGSSLAYHPDERLAVTLQAGVMRDPKGFLNIQGDGAFSTEGAHDHVSFSSGVEYSWDNGVSVFGRGAMGWLPSRSFVSQSLLTGRDRVMTTSFGAGLTKSGLFSENDLFLISAGQPERIEAGRLQVRYGTGVSDAGALLLSSGDVDLAPEAREFLLFTGYGWSLMDGVGMASYASHAFNRDHVRGASETRIGAGIRVAY